MDATNPGTEVNAGNETHAGNDEVIDNDGLNDEGNEVQLDDDGNPVEQILEEEHEEIEHDGKKFNVPKELKDAFLRQKDYTQKTQEVADQRRQVEASVQQFHQDVQAHRQFFAEAAEAHVLDNQIKQYRAIDMNALYQTDPDQARQLDWQLRQLEQRRDHLVASITEKREQQALKTQQETARRGQEAAAFLEREIKGWTPGNELDKALNAYAASFDVKDIGPVIAGNPKLALILHKAYQFDQLQAKAAQKPKPPTQGKPVTRIAAAKGTAAKDPKDMTDAEYAAWRRGQIKRRS